MPTWVDTTVKLTPAFIALVVGMTGLYFAWLQHQTSEEKLRLDLYDKRLWRDF